MAVNTYMQQYQSNQVQTMTKGKLLIMLYDGAIRFLSIAQQKMKEKKLDEQSANIIRVQKILLELISTLDMKVGGEIAGGLLSIYEYMFDKLTNANINDDVASVTEVMGILTSLREAWVQAESALRGVVPVNSNS